MSTEAGLQVAREIAEALNRAGIDYAVIHGIERYPAAVGRDIDLIVDSRQIAAAVTHATRHFRDRGWHVVAHRRMNGHYWCFVAPPDRRMVFEFDLLPNLRWGPAVLVDRPEALTAIDVFKVDPWAAFVKRILIQVLGGGLGRLRARPEELVLSAAEERIVPERLADHVGGRLADALVTAVQTRCVDALQGLVSPLRRAVIVRSLRRPFTAAVSPFEWVRNECAASGFARPVLPILGIVGVDGVGKSSLLCHVTTEIRARLPVVGVETRHWRPRILPSLARLFGREDADAEHVARPPRRSAGRGQALRVAYYGLDYALGAWRDRSAAAQLTAVVYDRCVLDMLVDPLRFGLESSAGAALLRRIVSGPQLVVLLHDEACRILTRKGELDEAEIGRQQAAWFALAEQGLVHLVLPVTVPPDQLARRVVDFVIDRFLGMETLAPDAVSHSHMSGPCSAGGPSRLAAGAEE